MSLTIRTDVTAVKFFAEYILAGIGSCINIYNRQYLKLMQRIECLKGQKIYGIVASEGGDKILVFGGKQFTVLSVVGSEDVVLERVFDPVTCDDWLHSAVWRDNDKVALLTAHNVAQEWDTTNQVILYQNCSQDNSILYSGLLLPLVNDVLVFAGTVFSEVIIHRSGDDKPLHHLRGHRGVIFSISCQPENGVIVTTSDDRSVRIWKLENATHHYNTIEFWLTTNIVCTHEVYGHAARVMRSCITEHNIISVGEDSAICFWDYQGNLLRKNLTHQNGCIWSVDANKDQVITGGGDCGIILHPLSIASDYSETDVLSIGDDVPKKMVFSARKNIVVLNENDLVYYDVANKTETKHNLKHDSTYKLLSLSSCKQIISVADMNGKLDLFIENCKDTAEIHKIIDTKLQIGKILSMQWAGNRHLVFCNDKGAITVLAAKDTNTEIYDNFTLPQCKERWLTAVAMDTKNKILIAGDRCGNIHIYVQGQRDPIKSFSKVHGRYGPSSIAVRNNEIVTTGRDGAIKYFAIDNDVAEVKYMSSKDLEFQWVEKFVDRDENMICGFQERVFVVYNVKNNIKLLEVPCGGGHRSWDVIRYIEKVDKEYQEFIKLIYVKNSDINVNTFQLSKIVSRNIVNGSHSKETNCLKAHTSEIDNTVTYYISGGEDTTLRVSSINSELCFQDEIIFKQLSNIRALKTLELDDNKLLIISAGGRAQICVRTLQFTKVNDGIKVTAQELIDYLIKGTDKERKGNQNWRNCSVDFDPETRIMDIDVIKVKDEFIVFAGCSDAHLRVFNFKPKTNTFKFIKELKQHKTCILKTNCIKLLNEDVLITCTTRGEVTLWHITNKDEENIEIDPFFTMTTNKSGINSVDSMNIALNQLLIATGGDDNAIHMKLLTIKDQNNLNSIEVSSSWTMDKFHSSQVTGLRLLNEYMVTTSIDQRVTLCKWKVIENCIECEFVSQAYSDVADIQGMDVLSSTSDCITLCVYGKGMEVMSISKTK